MRGPERTHGLDFFLDFVILVDILLNFITDTYSNPGKTLNNRQVALKYITSYFVVDLLSFLPHLVTLE